jgi:hypothetical protein
MKANQAAGKKEMQHFAQRNSVRRWLSWQRRSEKNANRKTAIKQEMGRHASRRKKQWMRQLIPL